MNTMALVACKECKKEVAKSAKSCPHCGVAQPGVTAGEKAGGCLVIILMFVAAGWFLFPGDGGTTVTAAEIGDAWPLSAQEARLYCNSAGQRYMTVDGTRYALNGKALSAGLPRPDPVTKAGMTPSILIERAGQLCD